MGVLRLVFVLSCITFHPFLFCSHLDKGERERAECLFLLSSRFIVTASDLWLFHVVLWAGLHCVIVVFPDHICLLSVCYCGH